MSETSATFTVDCAGCCKSVTHPYDGIRTFEFRIEQLISKEGWVRRDFAPDVRIWFCGTECANHSHAALQCEEWWKKNSRTRLFSNHEITIATMLALIVLICIFFSLQWLFGR